MKCFLILSSLISNIVLGQTYTDEQMYKKTGEAIVKFYGLDVVGQEAFKRLQEKALPKKYHAYIPYFGTLYSVFVDKKIVFRQEF